MVVAESVNTKVFGVFRGLQDAIGGGECMSLRKLRNHTSLSSTKARKQIFTGEVVSINTRALGVV